MKLTSVLFLIMIIPMELLAQSQELYSLSGVSFNTRDYDEYAPVFFQEGLVFCSNRPQSLFIQRTDTLGLPLSDYYFVKRNEKQRWESPKLFSKELNSRFNEAALAFSSDGKLVYFQRTEGYTSDLYYARFNGVTWEQITPFQYNELKSKTAQPFLSGDGQKLFFSSNRRGGYGGFDLYVCTWDKTLNQWNKPKNLGPEINSPANEEYPFLHVNGKLYFASNRKGGIGGFDIYYSMEINGHWIKPVLLKEPLNSSRNEVSYISDSLDRHGYISSDRSNRNNLFDIYEFTMNFPIIDRSKCKPQKVNRYIYTFEENSVMNTDTTTFLYEWDFGDGSKVRGRDLKVKHEFAQKGDYRVQLNVIDTLTGEVMLNQASNLYEVRDYEQPFITCPDSVKANQEFALDGLKSYLPDFKIINYCWDFDDGTIDTGAEVKHTFETPGTYSVILCITYTDADGKNASISRYRKVKVVAPTSP